MKPNDSTPSPDAPLNTDTHGGSPPTKEAFPEVNLPETDPWIVYSDRLRAVIHHENELVNHRIHWLVLLNGLAFTATGVLWGKEGVFPILIALGVAGATSTFSCYLALQGGRSALEKINRDWRESGGEGKRKKAAIAPISARPKCIDIPVMWKDGAWIDNRLTRKLHPLNAIPVVIILLWWVVVGNLCWNKFYQRDTETFPVRLTHRGLEIEVKEAEEAAPARVVGEGAGQTVPPEVPQVPVPPSGNSPTVPGTGGAAPLPAPDGSSQEPLRSK